MKVVANGQSSVLMSHNEDISQGSLPQHLLFSFMRALPKPFSDQSKHLGDDATIQGRISKINNLKGALQVTYPLTKLKAFNFEITCFLFHYTNNQFVLFHLHRWNL